MAVTIEPTPNPNALKFTVGRDVGGPKTFVADTDIPDPMPAAILQIDGVTSVFMTADFVTLSKQAEATWETIAPAAQAILESHFPD